MRGLLNSRPAVLSACSTKLAVRSVRAVPAPVHRANTHVVRVAMEEQTSTSFELIGVSEEGLPMPVTPAGPRLFEVDAALAEEYGEIGLLDALCSCMRRLKFTLRTPYHHPVTPDSSKCGRLHIFHSFGGVEH